MKQNATATAKGFIYQFYEAIAWCWKLTKGQKVYIETFGDIAVSQEANIEVKNVAGSLTDMGECFWKTLGNWLDDKFSEEEYIRLILITTQEISKHSSLIGWNESDAKKRLDILNEIIFQAESKYKEKLEAYNENETLGKEKNKGLKKPKINIHISKVSDKIKSKKLFNIISKFLIMDSSPLFDERYNEICDLYGKGVLRKNVTAYINAQLGYIISPISVSNNWEISFDDFNDEISHLTQTYASGSRVFPLSIIKEIDVAKYNSYLFVSKINDINYNAVIDSACTDYAKSLSIISESFSSGEPRKRYDNYLQEVITSFDTLHRRCSRRCTHEVELDSQDFYDDFTLLPAPTLSGYESTQSSFRNGVVHIQMDDSSKNKVWSLK